MKAILCASCGAKEMSDTTATITVTRRDWCGHCRHSHENDFTLHFCRVQCLIAYARDKDKALAAMAVGPAESPISRG